jgi:hypothetical protein
MSTSSAAALFLLVACGSATPLDGWSGPAGDADGDGFTVAEGDCDDGDALATPLTGTDACDGVDSDCDGAIDEDFAGDDYEPNDDQGFDLGELGAEGEAFAQGFLFPDSDVDRFRFRVVDADFAWFSVEAWLYDVPEDADYALELGWVEDLSGNDRGLVAQADDGGPGGYEILEWGGVVGQDNSGVYELAIRAERGSGCAFPYRLQVLSGGL